MVTYDVIADSYRDTYNSYINNQQSGVNSKVKKLEYLNNNLQSLDKIAQLFVTKVP